MHKAPADDVRQPVLCFTIEPLYCWGLVTDSVDNVLYYWVIPATERTTKTVTAMIRTTRRHSNFKPTPYVSQMCTSIGVIVISMKLHLLAFDLSTQNGILSPRWDVWTERVDRQCIAGCRVRSDKLQSGKRVNQSADGPWAVYQVWSS